MKTVSFGSAPLGMDNVAMETALSPKAMRDIVNFDVSNTGILECRAGARRLTTKDKCHSLWSPRSKNFGLFVDDLSLKKLTPIVGGALSTSTVLADLQTNDPLKYYEYAGDVYFTNGKDLGVVTSSGAHRLGVAPALFPPTLDSVTGGLPPGKYACAFSYITSTGEESALSPAAFWDVADGGVLVNLPWEFPDRASAVRVYATLTNGDLLYMYQEVPIGTQSVRVQQLPDGKLTSTQFLSQMVGGSDVSVYNGRVYVSRGDVLWASDPFNFGLVDMGSGFVSFGAEILFHEPVVDGIYVGTAAGVFFLAGGGPKDFKQSLVTTAPVMNDSISLPGAFMAELNTEGRPDPNIGADVAVWLGAHGFIIGYPSGAVKEVQSQHIALGEQGSGSLAAVAANGIRRVVSLVETATRRAGGSASDSFI
jgi:hypothetical protein